MIKPKLIKITLRLPEDYLVELILEATELSISVAELLRSKLITTQTNKGI